MVTRPSISGRLPRASSAFTSVQLRGHPESGRQNTRNRESPRDANRANDRMTGVSGILQSTAKFLTVAVPLLDALPGYYK